MMMRSMLPRCVFAVIGLLCVLLSGCEKAGEAAKPPGAAPAVEPVTVTVAPVLREPMDRTVDVVGTLYGDEEAVISAKVPGRIVKIHKDIGDRIAPGEMLVEIDPIDYSLIVSQRELSVGEALAKLGLAELPPADFDVSSVATVQRAKLQSDNAKARRDRGERLFRQTPPLISEQDFEDLQTAYAVSMRDADVALLEAKSQLAMARARQSELHAARQRLEDSRVRAPAGGSEAISAATQSAADRYAVAARNVSIGEYVSEGDALFQLVADDPLNFAQRSRNVSSARCRSASRFCFRSKGCRTPSRERCRASAPA